MRNLSFLLLAILLLCGLTMQAQAAQIKPAPDQRFGMTETFWLPEEAMDLGVGWERILFYWREIQPTGPEDWNTLHVREEWLAEANSKGRMVVGLLKNTPAWASTDGTEAGIPKGLYLPIDDPENLWAQFVRQIASYYGSRNVHHWILWNEPEIGPGVFGHEFAGSVGDYYQLLKVTYKVMKQTDPKATIHLAGLTWWHDQNYLGQLFELMINDPEGAQHDYFFDVISLHIYFRSETMHSVISSVQAVEQQFGFDKPIWVNETNAPPNLDPEWPVSRPLFDIDLDQQAWFIVQAMSLGFATGAERISAYKLVDINLPPGGESFGLVRPDLSHRPAYDAYKLSATYLHGFSDADLIKTPEYFLISFDRPSGRTHVAWSRLPIAVDITIPAKLDEATLIDLNGQRMQITPSAEGYALHLEGARCSEECLVGGPPRIVVEDESQPFASPVSEELNIDSVNDIVNLDERIAEVVASMTPVPTATSISNSLRSEAVSATDNDIMANLDIESKQLPENSPPSESGGGILMDTPKQPVDGRRTEMTGIWVIGLGLLVAAVLVLVVLRGRSAG